MTATRFYYAAHSYMGLNYTYDSPCWMVYAFDSRAARDEWLRDNEYNGQQYVAQACTRKTAIKIAPQLRHSPPGEAWRTAYR